MKIRAGIVGGAGYTGGEMLRLLINHPAVELVFVHSNSNEGNLISDVHTDLFGDTDLRFTGTLTSDIDVLFLCVGHGDAKKFLIANSIDERIKIIDLSQDFRLKAAAGLDWVYGMPEINKEKIRTAKYVANPGCFATAIQLGLKKEVHINATTGSTGAGQGLSTTSHFSWRNNNLSAYKVFNHQHLHEIGESLLQLDPQFDAAINFIPQRGAFSRGILATMYVESDLTEQEAQALYTDFYQDAAFTHVSTKNIDLKQVVNTNKCLVHVAKHGNKLFIVTVIDNLLKGASGQAVQNMNLMFGLEERQGLQLKALAF
jgi:N-acetyl-gamma-glutamyl-phosphate reductase